MNAGGPPRSPAAAEASRRNGAASRGPVTAAGKAASSRNARKHGLFGAEAVAGAVSEAVAAVLSELERESRHSASWQREVATMAALRLSRASELVRHLQEDLAARLLDPSISAGMLGTLIEDLLRMQRHARRFRGQRDRALRKIRHLTAPPEDLGGDYGLSADGLS